MEPQTNTSSATHFSPAVDTSLGPAASDSDLVALQQKLSELVHEINNPLAIVSGNAQLLLELSRMMDLDPDVAKPIRDIEEASHRLAATIRQLSALKEGLGNDLPGGDGI